MSLNTEQALELFRSDDLIGIGREADALRRKLHPEGVVTYSVDGCVALSRSSPSRSNPRSGMEPCSFCGLYGPNRGQEHHGAASAPEVVEDQIRAIVEMGGTGVFLRGGEHLTLEASESLLRGIKKLFTELHLHCFSAPDVVRWARTGAFSMEDTLKRLRDAGLDSLSGEGAWILDDEIRYKYGLSECLTGDWLDVHRAAHRIGLPTAATMMFGLGESLEQRIRHLRLLFELQEETGGFRAFIPWSYSPKDGRAPAGRAEEATAAEYLKLLAISRLHLSNFTNIQSNGAVQGLKVSQFGLRFGGNDAGAVPVSSTEEEVRRAIRDAGFRPARRDTVYRALFLN